MHRKRADLCAARSAARSCLWRGWVGDRFNGPLRFEIGVIMMDRSILSRWARRASGLPVTLPALVLLAAGAIASSGCVSKARYIQVEQERDLCTTRSEQLQTQVESARSADEELVQEKIALETKLATLQTQGQELGSKLH